MCSATFLSSVIAMRSSVVLVVVACLVALSAGKYVELSDDTFDAATKDGKWLLELYLSPRRHRISITT